jgi:ABC-type lipoprotein release transport system permease subunit
MFGATVICAMISVILKQMDLGEAASWVIMSAVTVMTLIVIVGMFKGAAQEIRNKRLGYETK